MEKSNSELSLRTESSNGIKFEPGCIQPDPTNELLEEIKSFGIEKRPETATRNERKGGILKPQGSLEKYREERELLTNLEGNVSSDAGGVVLSQVKQESAKMKRAKQNVALQSIYKKMEENKQVGSIRLKSRRITMVNFLFQKKNYKIENFESNQVA